MSTDNRDYRFINLKQLALIKSIIAIPVATAIAVRKTNMESASKTALAAQNRTFKSHIGRQGSSPRACPLNCSRSLAFLGTSTGLIIFPGNALGAPGWGSMGFLDSSFLT